MFLQTCDDDVIPCFNILNIFLQFKYDFNVEPEIQPIGLKRTTFRLKAKFMLFRALMKQLI